MSKGARRSRKAGSPSIPQSNAFGADFLEVLKQHLEGNRVPESLAMLSGNVWLLSCDPIGCRLVQTALERSSQTDAAKLVAELHGHVWEAATSPHANYVLQKVVTHLTFNAAKFVALEVVNTAAKVAQHRYGCRIISRLLEFYSSQELVVQIVEELMKDVEDLRNSTFGHYVLQSVMEHGHERHRRRMLQVLLSDPRAFAKERHSSKLVETALQLSASEDQNSFLAQLSQPEIITDLALDRYGCYIAKVLLQHPTVDAQAAKDMIQSQRLRFQQTKHGQRMLADLDLGID